MTTVPQINTWVYANIIRPGYIICTGNGQRVEVQRVTTGYDTVTLDSGYGRVATVGYVDRVQVLGYFNPDV